MKRLLTILFVSLTALAAAQVWEKPIAPGLVYRMEIDPAVPRVIHALRFSPGAPTKAMTDLAGKAIYEETPAKGCETLGQMVAEQGAIAGINANFFPYTGDPIGAMVRSGELVSVPQVPRACFGWTNDPGSGLFGIATFQGSFQANGNETPIDNVDGECPQNGITLNNETAAFSLAKTPNVQVCIRVVNSDFSANGSVTGVVESLTADQASLAVPRGDVVLVGQGNKAPLLSSLHPNDKISFQFHSAGLDFSKIDQLVSGGPFLIKDGVIAPDPEAEKFRDDFTKQRHPRTAVGKTPNGDFWFVAVDGRQPMSDGATIREMADIMYNLGCRDAINLDGGGSTDMNIFGVNVNRPSENGERPLACGIFFFGPKPEKPTEPIAIDGPPALDMKDTVILHATAGGKPVADADVIWSAQGGAWIDQGGLLRPVKPGTATVTAWINGQIVTKEIAISGIPPKPRTTPSASRSGDRGKKKGGRG